MPVASSGVTHNCMANLKDLLRVSLCVFHLQKEPNQLQK